MWFVLMLLMLCTCGVNPNCSTFAVEGARFRGVHCSACKSRAVAPLLGRHGVTTVWDCAAGRGVGWVPRRQVKVARLQFGVMTDQGQSLWGASFSHVSRTNVISPSLEADFQDLFSDASRDVPLKSRNLPKSFFNEPDSFSIRPYIADGSASRPRKTGPTDKTHFIAIKTPSKKERHGHTPSPNPFDPKLCAGKSRQRKSKIKRRLVDSQTGRASAPPVLTDELNPETYHPNLRQSQCIVPHLLTEYCHHSRRNRSLPDLNALIRESPALSHLTTSLVSESPPHLVSEQEFPQLDTFQDVTTVPFNHSINDDGIWMPMDSEGGAIKQEPLEIATSTLGTLDDLFLFDTSISIDGTSFNP